MPRAYPLPTPASPLFAPSAWPLVRPLPLLPLGLADISYAVWYSYQHHAHVPDYLTALAVARASVLCFILAPSVRWRARGGFLVAAVGATLLGAVWAVCSQTMIREGRVVALTYLAVTSVMAVFEYIFYLLLVRLVPARLFALRGPPPGSPNLTSLSPSLTPMPLPGGRRRYSRGSRSFKRGASSRGEIPALFSTPREGETHGRYRSVTGSGIGAGAGAGSGSVPVGYRSRERSRENSRSRSYTRSPPTTMVLRSGSGSASGSRFDPYGQGQSSSSRPQSYLPTHSQAPSRRASHSRTAAISPRSPPILSPIERDRERLERAEGGAGAGGKGRSREASFFDSPRILEVDNEDTEEVADAVKDGDISELDHVHDHDAGYDRDEEDLPDDKLEHDNDAEGSGMKELELPASVLRDGDGDRTYATNWAEAGVSYDPSRLSPTMPTSYGALGLGPSPSRHSPKSARMHRPHNLDVERAEAGYLSEDTELEEYSRTPGSDSDSGEGYECEYDDYDMDSDASSSVSDSSIIDLPRPTLQPLEFEFDGPGAAGGLGGVAGIVGGVAAGVEAVGAVAGAAAGAAVDIASGAGELVRRSASARFLGRSWGSETEQQDSAWGYGTFGRG